MEFDLSRHITPGSKRHSRTIVLVICKGSNKNRAIAVRPRNLFLVIKGQMLTTIAGEAIKDCKPLF